MLKRQTGHLRLVWMSKSVIQSSDNSLGSTCMSSSKVVKWCTCRDELVLSIVNVSMHISQKKWPHGVTTTRRWSSSEIYTHTEEWVMVSWSRFTKTYLSERFKANGTFILQWRSLLKMKADPVRRFFWIGWIIDPLLGSLKSSHSSHSPCLNHERLTTGQLIEETSKHEWNTCFHWHYNEDSCGLACFSSLCLSQQIKVQKRKKVKMAMFQEAACELVCSGLLSLIVDKI